MQPNMYSNVGFRCESAYLAFSNYLLCKQINELILEDSKRILNDCLKIDKNNEDSLFFDDAKNVEIQSMHNILLDYVMAKDDKKAAFNKIRQLYTNIVNINDLKDNEVKELCSFFKDIVKLCIDKSQNIYNDNDSFFY